MTPSDLRDGRALGEDLVPVDVPMTRIVEVGIVLWAIALAVVLVVPSLHEGSRDWWPWCCGAGLGLGILGLFYVRRGRGNNVDAKPHPLD